MDAEVSRPKFSTSIENQVDRREAFDADLERKGKQRVTKCSFGRAMSVEGTKPPANIKPAYHRSVEIQTPDENGFYRSPHRAHITEPQEAQLPDPASMQSPGFDALKRQMEEEQRRGW